MKVVIIGGVAGGASAATRLRRISLNEKTELKADMIPLGPGVTPDTTLELLPSL
jgi:NADPH-dependent 2,4-dienoyl-CoA reductase/sulfur reductase-like enzyme